MNERIHRQALNDTTPKKFFLRDGKYLDLTGYSVTMKLTRKNVVKMNRVITNLDQVNEKGGVEWTPLVGEVNEIGRYKLEITADNGANTLLFPRGNRQRFYIWIE